MWRRWWVYGSPTLKQSFNAVVAHGFFQGRNFNFNTGISPKCCSLLGLRAMLTICYGETRTLCFPAFLPVGSTRALSSDSPSSSSSSSPPSSSSQSSTKSGKSNSGSNADQKRGKRVTGEEDIISFEEAKKLMRLVNVESLKVKLGIKGKEVISYTELLEACENIGVARSLEEAIAFVRVLDEAGVVLLFRDKVYLHPDKVVALVRRAVPLALTPENDPIREELKTLLGKKEEIDMLAHKQVRRILWVGLGLSLLQLMLFLRLTFWEFSWDVMEPIAFFTTSTGIVIGYAYFLFTSRDPTYVDLMKRLFLNRQRKLLKRYNFDVQRMKELQRKCITPLDAASLIKKRTGFELELDDALHKDH